MRNDKFIYYQKFNHLTRKEELQMQKKIIIYFKSKIIKPDNIEVFDIFSRSQKKVNIKNKRELIDISGLSKGVYFILIKYEKKIFSYKFIKN